METIMDFICGLVFCAGLAFLVYQLLELGDEVIRWLVMRGDR